MGDRKRTLTNVPFTTGLSHKGNLTEDTRCVRTVPATADYRQARQPGFGWGVVRAIDQRFLYSSVNIAISGSRDLGSLALMSSAP